MKRRLRLLFSAEWARFALVIAAATAVHWFGSTSEHMLEHTLHHGLEWNLYDVVTILISIGLLCRVWQIWRHSREHSGVIVHSAGAAHLCPNPALFLSLPYTGDPPEADRAALLGSIQQARLDLSAADWCPPFLCNSPWRMPLEAIAHHARMAAASGGRLEAVYLIASPQSLQYAALFRRLVEEGLGQEHLVNPQTHTVSFDDFSEISEAVNRVFREVEERSKCRDLDGYHWRQQDLQCGGCRPLLRKGPARSVRPWSGGIPGCGV